MSVKITGYDEMMKKLESELSPAQIRIKSTEALKHAAPEVVDRIKKNMELFKDTGASIDETKVKIVPYGLSSVKIIIYWEGPKNRWRLIHLNEKGYTRDGKRYNPAGKGAIARALREGEIEYFKRIKEALER